MKTKKIVVTAICSILFLIIGMGVSNADYSASNPSVTSGEKVSITVNSSTALDSYNLDLQTAGGLTFNSCSKAQEGAIIIVNGSSIGYMNTSGTTKTLGTYQFTAPTVTEKRVYTVIFNINQATSVKATVTVNPKNGGGTSTPTPTPQPTESTLSSMTVGGKKWNNPSTSKTYTMTVDNSVKSVSVKAVVSGDASYSVSSDKGDSGSSMKLEVGSNLISIKLSNGKVYKVNVSRKEDIAEETPPNVVEEETPQEEKLLLTSLKIEGYTLTPEFSSEIYSYTIETEIPEQVEELIVEGIANAEGATVEIQGNKELKEGENIINVIVKSADGTKTITYQIKVNKAKVEIQPISASVDIPQEVKNPRWNTTQKILITVFTIIIAGMGVAFGVIEYRDTKQKNAEEDSQEDTEEVEYPYAKIGFETQEDPEESKQVEEIEEKIQEEKETKSKNKGKHF